MTHALVILSEAMGRVFVWKCTGVRFRFKTDRYKNDCYTSWAGMRPAVTTMHPAISLSAAGME